MLLQNNLMSYKIEFDLFQSCKALGDYNTLDAPFLSRERNQWLSQGYYFWTDSVFYAEKWGKGKRYVYQFKYIVEKEHVLDLVGSVKDQLVFIEDYLETFKILTRSISALKKYEHKNVPIGVIIEILRKYDEFPYRAIKAYDIPYTTKKFKYLEHKPEATSIPTRQQMVIFKEFLDNDLKQSKQFLREVEV